MQSYRFRFEDRTTLQLNAVSFVSALYAAQDWHTRVHYRSGSHVPVLIMRSKARGVVR